MGKIDYIVHNSVVFFSFDNLVHRQSISLDYFYWIGKFIRFIETEYPCVLNGYRYSL